MSKTKLILLTAACALLVCASAGAANLTVDDTKGLGPGTSATCPNGCRLQVNMTNDTVKAHVIDNSPDAERTYRFEFYIHPNEMPMPERSALRIAEVRKGNPGALVLITANLVFRNGQFKVRFSIIDDNGANVRIGQLALNPDKKALIEAEWQTSTGADDDNGLMTIRKGTKVKGRTDLDNFVNGTDGIDQIKFGYVKAGDPAIAGAFWLDDFSSFRTLEPIM